MNRSGLNPWPAMVDLFSALLIVTFSGFILLFAAQKEAAVEGLEVEAELARCRDELDAVRQRFRDCVRELERCRTESEGSGTMKQWQRKALEALEDVNERLELAGLGGGEVRACADAACLDIQFHFATDEAELLPDDVPRVRATCAALKRALDEIADEHRTMLDIVLEGHSDARQPRVDDARGRFVYNWELSARRAASVLYEFAAHCGLDPARYPVRAIGLADSDPIETLAEQCGPEPAAECRTEWYDRNRRTTIRLEPNTQRIWERIAAAE